MEGTKRKPSVCVRRRTQTGGFLQHARNYISVEKNHRMKRHIFQHIEKVYIHNSF